MIYIYGLYDRGGHLRYVGQTSNPKGRLAGHWKDAHRRGKPGAKNDWLRRLWESPDMRILVIVEESDARRTEVAATLAARIRFGDKQILNAQNGSHNDIWRASRLSPERLEAQSERYRKLWQNPEYRAKMTAMLESLWTPERRAAMSETLREIFSDPEYRARLSESFRRRFADPEKLAEHTERMNDPETRAKMRTSSAKRWNDPEASSPQSAAQRAKWQDPEFRAAQTAMQKAKWADPEIRAKRIAIMKLAAARRAAGLCTACGGRLGEYDPACWKCRRRQRQQHHG